MDAFVLRISPSGIDRVAEALDEDELIVGWAEAEGLLDRTIDWYSFRDIVYREYYAEDASQRRAGAAAGHLWRFIRDMQPGDLVVVPHGSNFYVAEVVGDALYRDEKREDDTAYRRPVKWLNDKKPIPRSFARVALISRMKIYGTSATASDLVDEIRECVDLSGDDEVPDFRDDLQSGLVRRALNELRNGRLDNYGFEHLIKSLLLNVGATDARVVWRGHDKGADVLATFQLADTFPFVVAVQAKHWRPDPPVGRDVVTELVSGMEAEDADLGMVVTTGSFSSDAFDAVVEYMEASGKRIELVDGEQFAKMIVEHGIGDA